MGISDTENIATLAQPPRRRFLRDKKGSAAIEFAVLAIPFFLMVFAIIESCLSFTAQQVLQNATDEYARQVRTGQLQISDITLAKSKTFICDRINLIVQEDCPGLYIDLKEYDSFEDAAKVHTKFKIDEDGTRDLDDTGFDAIVGGPVSINMIRVYYKWPVMTDFMRASLSNIAGGKTLHFATSTWRNEPFSSSGGGGGGG
jgi:Flp pilus assembly protein TadG